MVNLLLSRVTPLLRKTKLTSMRHAIGLPYPKVVACLSHPLTGVDQRRNFYIFLSKSYLDRCCRVHAQFSHMRD